MADGAKQGRAAHGLSDLIGPAARSARLHLDLRAAALTGQVRQPAGVAAVPPRWWVDAAGADRGRASGSTPDGEAFKGEHDLIDHQAGRHKAQEALGHGTEWTPTTCTRAADEPVLKADPHRRGSPRNRAG